MTDVLERLEAEYLALDEVLAAAKRIEWWKLYDYSRYNYSLVSAASDICSAENTLEKIARTINGIKYADYEEPLTRKRKAELVEDLHKRGYIYESIDDAHGAWGSNQVGHLREHINKCKEV